MQKILFIFFILTQLIFSVSYIPKNIKEEKVLENLRKNVIVVGLKTSELENKKIDGESLNSILQEMLQEYLGLNVKFIKEDKNKLDLLYDEKKIDVLPLVNQSEERKKNTIFTLPIFEDSLYLVSFKKNSFNPESLKSLNGKEIYITKKPIYYSYLTKFLKNNNLDMNIIQIENSFLEKDKIILTSKHNIVGWEDSVKIANLPNVAIGLKKNLHDLSSIINNALLEKYKNRIDIYLEKREVEMFKDKFEDNLTLEEKKYLTNLPTIKIGVRLNDTLNFYSKNLQKHIGVIPLFLDDFSKKTGLKFKMTSNRTNNWNRLYDDFLEKKIKVLPLSESESLDENIIFTKQIYEPTLYKISSFYNLNTKVGVIKNSVEHSYIKDYYDSSEIEVFSAYKDLVKAINTNKVNSILLFDINKIDTSKFKVEEFLKIPIFLGLHKEDSILRDILNKVIKNSINLDSIKELSESIKKQEAFNEYHQFKIINKILYMLLVASGIIVTVSLSKIFSNEKIKKELKKDWLTGLPNRKEFLEFISKNQNLEGYAIAIDIDNFKELNDKYGEVVGDKVLKMISQSIKIVFEEEEIYKVAGDEFYIFISNEDVVEKLEKLKREIKILNTIYRLNLSIGYYKNRDEKLEMAFKFAAMGMEEAKKENETYYLEATDDLIKRKKRENSIKSLLRGYNLSGLYAVYQPKFDIKTKAIVGGEALARWQTNDLGFLSPFEFIDIAEKINLIHLIDFEIAAQTIKFIKLLKEKNIVDENFKISFNLSMKTLERDDVVDKIKSLLENNSARGEWVEVEITESIFSTNLKVTLEKLNLIKGLGISLAMDDFTAGHSTVSLLPILPLDSIKFDKAILDAIGTKDNLVASNIYSALIKLVKGLKVKIVAEGIETVAQLKFLEKISVSIGQGYIFSKPITREEFQEKLEKKT